MLKLSRSLVHRKQLTRNLLTDKVGDVGDASRLSNFTSRFGFSTARSDIMNGNYSGRAYADFSIYKGKAALSVSPVLPKFSKLDSGFSKVEKKGVVMLKFLPAIGPRKYDNEKKQHFALSATEVGSLISLGPTESCEFFHDPSMKSSLEGQVKKTLAVSPINDGSGYFFNLSVLNSAQKTTERISVPVTKAEFAVMRTAFGFALPHIMGWDRLVTPQLSSAPSQMKAPEMGLSPDFEWGR